MRYFLIIFFIFLNNCSFSQNLNGIWYGNYEKQLLVARPKQLVVEMQITHDSVINGASHLYYNNDKFEHYKLKGVVRLKDSIVYFREDSTLAVKLGLFESNCAGSYTMKLRVTDSSYILEGKWKDNARGFLNCPASGVFLEKKFLKDSTGAVTTPSNRITELQSLIEYHVEEKDSIRIDVYDNGEIDNDVISLYFNDDVLVQKLRITDKGSSYYISMKPSEKFNKVYMVAESLGDIPPCTALLIITTKRKRYEVNLSGNMSKNAALEFFLKE